MMDFKSLYQSEIERINNEQEEEKRKQEEQEILRKSGEKTKSLESITGLLVARKLYRIDKYDYLRQVLALVHPDKWKDIHSDDHIDQQEQYDGYRKLAGLGREGFGTGGYLKIKHDDVVWLMRSANTLYLFETIRYSFWTEYIFTFSQKKKRFEYPYGLTSTKEVHNKWKSQYLRLQNMLYGSQKYIHITIDSWFDDSLINGEPPLGGYNEHRCELFLFSDGWFTIRGWSHYASSDEVFLNSLECQKKIAKAIAELNSMPNGRTFEDFHEYNDTSYDPDR